MYTLLRHVSAVAHDFPLTDHKSQPKCNWTWSAAAKLSLSLITNFSRGQLKLGNEQCWRCCPRQRTLIVLQIHNWRARRVSCLPPMLKTSINTRNSENTASAHSLMMPEHLSQAQIYFSSCPLSLWQGISYLQPMCKFRYRNINIFIRCGGLTTVRCSCCYMLSKKKQFLEGINRRLNKENLTANTEVLARLRCVYVLRGCQSTQTIKRSSLRVCHHHGRLR